MSGVQIGRTGSVDIGRRNRLVGRRAVAVLLGASAARHFLSPDWMRGLIWGGQQNISQDLKSSKFPNITGWTPLILRGRKGGSVL